MMGRKPPFDRRRAPSAYSASNSRVAAGIPPFLRERQAIEAILHAESTERPSVLTPFADMQSAVDCLALLVKSLDSGVGVERALAEARATLKRLGREPISPAP
ncbi:MAG TPA: hypothetical protein VIG55_05925 [Methylosinus sp.]|jgi:hypothetical protein